MSRSRTPARNEVTDPSGTAEKARLEAKLAKREAWRSLQRLLDRPNGTSLVDAIEAATERERLERELADTCEDYRSWVALSANAGPEGASNADTPQFKTRVRIKAATTTKVAINGKRAAVPAAAPPPKPATAIAAAPAPTSSRLIEPSRVSPEEARVVIVRRAKDGTVTRVELPVATRMPPGRGRSERPARMADTPQPAPDTAPQPIAKRPGKR